MTIPLHGAGKNDLLKVRPLRKEEWLVIIHQVMQINDVSFIQNRADVL